jgi:hypothetical protein
MTSSEHIKHTRLKSRVNELEAALRAVEFYMIDVSFPKDHHALLTIQKALRPASETGGEPRG